jgi:hypothetical protein
MREKYLVGILAENSQLPTPVEAVDFIDFDRKALDGRPVMRIRFCPFCGGLVEGPVRVPHE